MLPPVSQWKGIQEKKQFWRKRIKSQKVRKGGYRELTFLGRG